MNDTQRTKQNSRMRLCLETIRDYPPKGSGRRDEYGYPIEFTYDEFAYKRFVDAVRDAASRGLEEDESLGVPDFLDTLIAESENESPGFAAKVEELYKRKVAERAEPVVFVVMTGVDYEGETIVYAGIDTDETLKAWKERLPRTPHLPRHKHLNHDYVILQVWHAGAKYREHEERVRYTS